MTRSSLYIFDLFGLKVWSKTQWPHLKYKAVQQLNTTSTLILSKSDWESDGQATRACSDMLIVTLQTPLMSLTGDLDQSVLLKISVVLSETPVERVWGFSVIS